MPQKVASTVLTKHRKDGKERQQVGAKKGPERKEPKKEEREAGHTLWPTLVCESKKVRGADLTLLYCELSMCVVVSSFLVYIFIYHVFVLLYM